MKRNYRRSLYRGTYSRSTPYFNQFNIEYTASLPSTQPEIGQIIDLQAQPKVLSHQILKTPIGTSLEGQHLTGHVLLVLGQIDYRVQYKGKGDCHSLYNATFTVPFCGSVALPEKLNGHSFIAPSVIIESIDPQQLSPNCIYTNFTLLLSVYGCRSNKKPSASRGKRSCFTYNQYKLPPTANYFNEEVICGSIQLTGNHPPIGDILALTVNASVEKTELIDTQDGVSYEGQELTGKKLLVELKLTKTLRYSPCDPCLPISTTTFIQHFSTYIVLPSCIEGTPVEELYHAGLLQPRPYIEGTSFHLLCPQLIQDCILLFIDVAC